MTEPEQHRSASPSPEAAGEEAAAGGEAQGGAAEKQEQQQQQDQGPAQDVQQDALQAMGFPELAVPATPATRRHVNLMPAVAQLVSQIMRHLNEPGGQPELALTFQPLVKMALELQVHAARGRVLAPGGGAVTAVHPTGEAAGGSQQGEQQGEQQREQQRQQMEQQRKQQQEQQQQQQEQQQRQQQEDQEAQEPEPLQPKSAPRKSPSRASQALRPQRQRRKSSALQGYLTDEEEGPEPQRRRRG